MSCKFSIKTFDDLTSVDLYHILKARSQVFVVEQQCPYQDMDGIDFDCLHLVAHQDEKLVGYCRIIPAKYNTIKTSHDVSHVPMAAIGRVLVLPAYRGASIAQQIMTEAIKYCRKKYGKKPIIIAAQTYLIHFYESLGFVIEGERYFEDGLEHVLMVLQLKKPKVKKEGTSTVTTVIWQGLLLMISVFFVLGVLYLMV